MFWAMKEANKILKKFQNQDKILLEIGYSPSGKIHIGTFHEAKRTNAIKTALQTISNKQCEIICFSDDMDGLRKVPSDLPQQEMLKKHIQNPLSKIPDPYERDNSYAEHYNNNMKNFLQNLNIKHQFISSTEEYSSGRFNNILQKVYDKYDEIMNVMLPHLREERRRTYSPFLPICSISNQVLQVPTELNKENNTIIFTNSQGNKEETTIFNGKCKLQWKVDFAARWSVLGIHYEMMGKDHTTNLKIYQQLCRILDGQPPISMTYEMFLNEEGRKISKSSSTSQTVTLEDWLKYTIPEALEFFILQYPQKARIMSYNSIIQATDEYIQTIQNHFNNIKEKIQQNQKDTQENKMKEFSILNAIHDQNIPNIAIN
ncbi:MAG: lysine--tRNA ligase [Pseudomonadota bacterium]